MVVPNKSPTGGLIGALMPKPTLLVPTTQMLPLAKPPSVNKFVAVKVNERSASKNTLLKMMVLAVIETSPPAVKTTLVVSFVMVVVKENNVNEPTPLEMIPLLTKLSAQADAPPTVLRTPLLISER